MTSKPNVNPADVVALRNCVDELEYHADTCSLNHLYHAAGSIRRALEDIETHLRMLDSAHQPTSAPKTQTDGNPPPP